MTKNEVSELLSGFEQRMKFFYIVNSLRVGSCPDEIAAKFQGAQGLDVLNNLSMMVVLFIEEKTLSEDERCTLSDVADFLQAADTLLPEEYQGFPPDRMAAFLVVNILQKSGKRILYPVYDSTAGAFRTGTLRLLNEEKGAYTLTDEVFDFLFRSKEIESELDYSVTRFKMQEYMKRRNFSEALGQSRDLVQQIRNMKRNLSDFLIRCRENIARISAEDYQGLIERYRNLMDDEYQELMELSATTDREIARFQEAIQEGADNQETQKNLQSVMEIHENLMTTINEQRSLINQKDLVSDEYDRILRDSFKVEDFERLNFEKDIMAPLRQLPDGRLGDAALTLLYPLETPVFQKLFNIESFYQPIDRLGEEEKQEGLNLEEGEDILAQDARRKNAAYLEIGRAFFSYAASHRSFSVSEFIGAQKMTDLLAWTDHQLLPNMLLSMYQYQEIDLKALRGRTDMLLTDPEGEFNLLWILSGIREVIPNDMNNIIFTGSDGTCRYTVGEGEESRTIELSDFLVEAEA